MRKTCFEFKCSHLGQGDPCKQSLIREWQLFDPAIALTYELAAPVVVRHDHLNALLGGLAQLGLRQVDGHLVQVSRVTF